MLNSELLDTSIPVVDAEFSKEGDPRYFWTERVSALEEEVALTWYDIGEPLLIHTQPNADPVRPYGRLHRADPGPRRATDTERRAGGGPALGAASAKAARSAPARSPSPKAGPPNAERRSGTASE
ncbi:MAG: hypothetical protein WDN25_15145 [Acetobacteraceae bacterium]